MGERVSQNERKTPGLLSGKKGKRRSLNRDRRKQQQQHGRRCFSRVVTTGRLTNKFKTKATMVKLQSKSSMVSTTRRWATGSLWKKEEATLLSWKRKCAEASSVRCFAFWQCSFL